MGQTFKQNKIPRQRHAVSQPKGGSSHYIFRKPGCNPITIPNHEPIKVVYVKMVKEIVESEEKNKED